MRAGAAPPAGGAAAAPAFRRLTNPEAIAILQRLPSFDAASTRVVARARRTYGHLKSLQTRTTGRGIETIARLKRPRYYHYMQRKPDGELIALAVSDGEHYYEYTERTQTYLLRDAVILDRISLPANARYFFPTQKPELVMEGLDGQPATRDFDYRYLGARTIAGKKAEGVRVSTLLRAGKDSWIAFESDRYFDAGSALLVQVVNGNSITKIENRTNPALPTAEFRWEPIVGAKRGFG
jgi:hypothetical protein